MLKKAVKKVKGKKVKTYKGCQIWLDNGTYNVYYKGESFPCKSLKFAIGLIDAWKNK